MTPDSAPRKPFALDPVAFMVNECMLISLAMRKSNRWMSGSVAAIFGATDFFAEDDALVPPASQGRPTLGAPANPLHLGFLQLRHILLESQDIMDVDSLTLLQPFLLTIELSLTLGVVTTLALSAVAKMIRYEIILLHSRNIASALQQLTLSLTHCRFEASDQNTDDSVLLKVLRLLETIVTSPLSVLLSNPVLSEVIHTCLSLACNKRRSEVLRRAAEMAMTTMTIRIFQRMKELEPESSKGEDLPPSFAELHPDVIGHASTDNVLAMNAAISSTVDITVATTDAATPAHTEESNVSFEQFDIHCIDEFLGLLISMCSPTNQYQHMELTRVFALSLIHTAIEVAGDNMPDHPSTMALLADPVSKDVLQIISSTDFSALLQAALRLFCTMAVVFKNHLKSQIELTFNILFKSILPEKANIDKNMKGNTTAVSQRGTSSKELIIDALSYLWTVSPQFFAELFVEYDCDFEKSDLAATFIDFLCELALPESALVTTDSVPPICLDGVLSFISGVNTRSKLPASPLDAAAESLVARKMQKKSFIKCTEIFNKSPSKGIAALCELKFIENPSDPKELAAFVFQKSTRLNKKVLGEYLAKPANKDILREFMALFDFQGLRVDEGLRMMLKSFRLPGESQQIERIVETFADSFVSQQLSEEDAPLDAEKEHVTPDRDAVFILSYSIIMLNTDLHNPQVKKQMDLESYRKNLKGVYNGKDFPEWYMASIYNSIREREIIMPEEHHGTDKWFDDVWHNLISLQSKWEKDHGKETQHFENSMLRHFDRILFESVVDKVVSTLITVFKEATDDNVITKLMSSIDKCAAICVHYDLHESTDKLILALSEVTTLAHRQDSTNPTELPMRPEFPITQVGFDDKEDHVTVSELSVHFGRDFKAQLSTLVLARLIKKPKCEISPAWDVVIKIALNLFENCLVDANLFNDFQKKLRLPPLPKVKPHYRVQRSKSLKESGLLSTFSSFLKSYSDDAPEPSDLEVEATNSAIACVKSLEIATFLQAVSKSKKENVKLFIGLVIDNCPEYDDQKKRFYEAEILFLSEILVCLSLIIQDEESIQLVHNKIVHFIDSQHVSKKGYIRLATYYFLLVRRDSSDHITKIDAVIKKLLTFDKQVIVGKGESLIPSLLSLIDDERNTKSLVSQQSFWDLLKVFSISGETAQELLDFCESMVKNHSVDSESYVPLLGILDEVSSSGAAAALSTGDTISEADRLLINTSKRSITLTGELGSAQKNQSYPLVQALAHQCFNPCREIRSHAVQVLQQTVFASQLDDKLNAQGLFEYALFPLLKELQKEETINSDKAGFSETQLQVLSLVGKSFLNFHENIPSDTVDKIWLDVVQAFASMSFKDPAVKEPSLEVMKNMILVLQSSFLTPENGSMWDETWKTLDTAFPNLKQEVLPQ